MRPPAQAGPPPPSNSEPCASAAPSAQSPAGPSSQSPPPAPEMREESPRSALLFRFSAYLAPLDSLQKRPRQLPFAGVALAMYRAQVKKLVAQSIPFFLLRQNRLQRQRQLAQPRRLRPGTVLLLASQMLVL